MQKKEQKTKSQNAAEEQITEISKDIEYYVAEYTIELLTDKLRKKTLVIPDYQREYTWDSPRKSKFIESILMGLPIPFIFFWLNPSSGKLEIVDGSQRLRSLAEFIHERFRLQKLEKIHKLNGLTFDDLTEARKLKFINMTIRAIILKEKTDTEARFDLFERINTGSKTVNSAEIRRAALPGLFTDMVLNLSESDIFKSLTPISSKLIKEREREELVLRFFAYGDGIDEYKGSVKNFLYSYLKKMNDRFSEQPDLQCAYEKRFSEIMLFISNKFPYGFHKSSNEKAVPRARFESIAVGVYHALRENANINEANIEKLLQSPDFKEITKSDAANVRSKLEKRINTTKDILLN